MGTFVEKVSAIPGFLLGKLVAIRTKYRRNQQLYMRAVCDVGKQCGSIKVEHNPKTSNSRFCQNPGIYKVDNVLLHRLSGLILVQEDVDMWPIGIVESGLEDYRALALRRQIYNYANQIDIKRTPVVKYAEPSYIFNVIYRKTNYYHFVIDSFSRLVTFLGSIDYPVNILHFCEREGAIGQYLDLVEDNYDCRFHKIATTGSRHIRIESTVIFLEETYLRLEHSIPHKLQTWNRLVDDPQLQYLDIQPDQLKPIRRNEQLQAKSWSLVGTNKIYKNNTGHYFYPDFQMNSLSQFGKRVLQEVKHDYSQRDSRLYIVRDKASSRARYIGNERELLERANLTKIDFSTLLVKEQIQAVDSCQFLVGLTGSGLTNCVYMNPGTCVVEVTPIGYSLPATNLFENICNVRGLRYERIFSTPLDENGSTIVNVEELRELIDR